MLEEAVFENVGYFLLFQQNTLPTNYILDSIELYNVEYDSSKSIITFNYFCGVDFRFFKNPIYRKYRINKDHILKELFLTKYNSLKVYHFKKTYIKEVHFKATHLVLADLSNTNLIRACLKCANIALGHLENACLEKACLENAYIELAHLENANLTNTNLNVANLFAAYLIGAKLHGSTLKQAY